MNKVGQDCICGVGGRVIVIAVLSLAICGRADAGDWVRPTPAKALVTPGAEASLVGQIESAVIIPGESHEELWVHPEIMTIPGTPVLVELRARSTDRFGKDHHTQWHYFRCDDSFSALQPLSNRTESVWQRKDLSVTDFVAPRAASVQMPAALGHTWCSAFVYLDDKTILQAFTSKEGPRYSVQTVAATVEKEGLAPLYLSNAWSNDKGRGLYEPHLAVYGGRCFMTVRAEDGRGYVLTSADRGRTWSAPKPWAWDNGEVVPMSQTMTKFAAHSEGLLLVYTRIREDNANVFRNRSPLHVADIDPETLSLKRATERIIVPNRPTWGKGFPVGNFWVWPINGRETCVTVAEWPRDGRPENGDIWLAKILWRRANRLLTPDGREQVAVSQHAGLGPVPTPLAVERLGSPILFKGDAVTAHRDPAAVYCDGWFRLFFTLVKTEPDGRVYSYAAWSKSRDLAHWSAPQMFTPRDVRLNFGSPGNLIRFGGEWVLCLQTYPRPNGEQYGNAESRVWTMRSKDLETWGAPELLRVKGPDVPREKMGRMIDPFLLADRDEPGKWWCFYKQNGVSRSWSRDLKTWSYAGHAEAGENACVILDSSDYVLFHSPANGIGVKRSKDLATWEDEGVLTLGQSAWPWAKGRLTAGFVLDLRNESSVGKALLFFHGSEFPENSPKGGFDTYASIGIAWSDDLKTWAWPGGAGPF